MDMKNDCTLQCALNIFQFKRCSHKYLLRYTCTLPSQVISSSSHRSSFQTVPYDQAFLITGYPNVDRSFCLLRNLSSFFSVPLQICISTIEAQDLLAPLGFPQPHLHVPPPLFQSSLLRVLGVFLSVSWAVCRDSPLSPCPCPVASPSVFQYLFSCLKAPINSCLLRECFYGLTSSLLGTL